MEPSSALLFGLPPILDGEATILILGSFPSPASLAAKHYYAHRQNQFWRIMGDLLAEPIMAFDYAEKKACLLRHEIGLWDVYRCCEREGALDAAIKRAELNDFSVLRLLAPRLKRVCFNGQTAGKHHRFFIGQGYATHILPSTSPAYTLAFTEKKTRWQAGLFGE